jgi:YHS domain-containing protein
MRNTTSIVSLLVMIAAAAAPGQDAAPAAEQVPAQPAVIKPFFGNEKCPVTGRSVDRELYIEKDGQRIYLCSMRCKRKVKDAFEDYLAKAYPEVKDLANAKCPIMPSRDAKESVTVDFQGYRIRFCCQRCVARFREQPRLHLALLLYPETQRVGNTMCPVMPEEKAQAEIFVIYKKKLVGLCCTTCVQDFEKSPDAFLAAAEAQARKGS